MTECAAAPSAGASLTWVERSEQSAPPPPPRSDSSCCSHRFRLAADASARHPPLGSPSWGHLCPPRGEGEKANPPQPQLLSGSSGRHEGGVEARQEGEGAKGTAGGGGRRGETRAKGKFFYSNPAAAAAAAAADETDASSALKITARISHASFKGGQAAGHVCPPLCLPVSLFCLHAPAAAS